MLVVFEIEKKNENSEWFTWRLGTFLTSLHTVLLFSFRLCFDCRFFVDSHVGGSCAQSPWPSLQPLVWSCQAVWLRWSSQSLPTSEWYAYPAVIDWDCLVYLFTTLLEYGYPLMFLMQLSVTRVNVSSSSVVVVVVVAFFCCRVPCKCWKKITAMCVWRWCGPWNTFCKVDYQNFTFSLPDRFFLTFDDRWMLVTWLCLDTLYDSTPSLPLPPPLPLSLSLSLSLPPIFIVLQVVAGIHNCNVLSIQPLLCLLSVGGGNGCIGSGCKTKSRWLCGMVNASSLRLWSWIFEVTDYTACIVWRQRTSFTVQSVTSILCTMHWSFTSRNWLPPRNPEPCQPTVEPRSLLNYVLLLNLCRRSSVKNMFSTHGVEKSHFRILIFCEVEKHAWVRLIGSRRAALPFNLLYLQQLHQHELICKRSGSVERHL